VQLAKTPEALAVYGATAAAGAVFLRQYPLYADEIAYSVGGCAAAVLVDRRARALGPIAHGMARN